MDEQAAVRELLAVPPPSQEAVAAWRERLLTEITADTPVRPARTPVLRTRKRAAWTAVLTGLAGIAAATALLLSSVPQASGAQTILLAAATQVAKAPDQGSWWGSELVKGKRFYDPAGRYQLEQTRSEETWIPADLEAMTWIAQRELGVRPLTPQDEVAWRADGSPTAWTYDKGTPGEREVVAAPGEREVFSTEDWDWRIVFAGRPLTRMDEIPDTPEGLRALLGEQELARRTTEIIAYFPVSAEVRAAAYRLLASLPGVSAAGEVKDPLGRPGQAIEYPGDPAATRVRLVIDQSTGAPLAVETYAADGRLTDFTAIKDSRWTDKKEI